MPSLNRATIMGHLGKDPEPAGENGCKFSVATSERWTDKTSGEKKERTDWHNIVVWGAQSEACKKYLSKGSLVFVEGRISTRSYEKDGQKHYMTDIVADRVQFLDSKKSDDTAPAAKAAQTVFKGAKTVSEDVPF